MKLKLNFIIRLNGTIATNIVVEILGVKKKRGIVSTMQSASNMSPFRPQLKSKDAEHHEHLRVCVQNVNKAPTQWIALQTIPTMANP